MTAYLTVEDAVRQVVRLGMDTRDAGLLASAVLRPQTSVFGQDAYPTLWLKSAALCQSADHNQSLVDGNKRLAWILTKTFLLMNGQKLSATKVEGAEFMLDIVAAKASLDEIAAWLRDHCTSAESPDFGSAR